MSQSEPDSHQPRTRRNFSPTEKVRLLRLHLLEGRPVSEICREADIAPTLFYLWQRTFFENGAAAFTPASNSSAAAQDKLVAKLEEQLARKDHVIAVVTEELVKTKKELGES